MAVNKYSRDYRLIEEFQANGRVRTGYEYIGKPWRYAVPEETVRAERKRALLLLLLAGAAFVAGLIPYAGAMHRLWVALPFAFTALPLFLTGDLLVSMQFWKEPMEHRQADKLNNRYPVVTMLTVFFAGISFAADLVFLIGNGFAVPGDAVLAVCMAVILVCAVLLFRKRGTFTAYEEAEDRPD